MQIKFLKSLLSKINFSLGRNPRITKAREKLSEKYIPRPYKAVVIISADFELAWAWRYAKAFQNPKQEAINRARMARKNIPKIVELCGRYDIPITWATVGHLFLEECCKDDNRAHANLMRIPYHENKYWKFDSGDWFDDDPCTDWHTSPEWYAPDLIEMILNSKAKHEIACHTFSHIDCGDEHCPSKSFIGEIELCRQLAKRYGIDLKSFVYPGNVIGNLDSLPQLGFRVFRTDYGNTLGYPLKHENGLWELQSTAEFYYRKEWSIHYCVSRYKKIVERAIKHNRVACYWFHPSVDSFVIEEVFPRLFRYFNNLMQRNVVLVTTAEKYVEFLDNN